MSTTLSAKPDEQLRKAQLKAMEEQQRKTEQKQRVSAQNAWFYQLIGVEPDEVADPANPSEKTLKHIRKKVAAAEKAEEVQQTQDVKEAGSEPLYKDRLARSQKALNELKSYEPAVTSLVTKFEAAHKKAADILAANPGAWKEALVALHDVHLSSLDKNREELWEKGKKAGRAAATEFFLKADSTREKLTAKRDVLTVETYEGLAGKLDLITGSLCDPDGPDAKRQTQATQELATFDASLDATIKNAINDKDIAATLRMDVENTLKIAKGAISPYGGFPQSALANFQRQFTSIDTNIGLRDYALAKQLLTALRTQIETKSDTIEVAGKMAQASWEAAKNDLASLKSRAGVLIKNQGLSESVRSAANETDQRIAALTAAKVGTEPTFAAAMIIVDGIKADLARLEQTAGNVPGFKAARDEADKRVRALMDQAAHGIEALPVALAKANGGKDINASTVVGPFNDTLAEILTRWEALMGSAVDASGLMENVVTADLRKLVADVNYAATTGAADAVLDINLAPARQEFQQVRGSAMSTAKSVMSLNVEAGVRLLEAIDSAESTVNAAITPKQIEAVTKTLKDLMAQYAETSGKAGRTIPESQQTLREKLEKVSESLKTLQQATDDTKKSADKRQPFSRLLGTLRSEYETLLVLVGSTQLAMLRQASDDADVLIDEIGAAIKDISGKTDNKDRTFDAAKKRMEGYTKRLAAGDVKTYTLATATELSEKLSGYTQNLGSITVTQLNAELDAIGEKVGAVEKKATESSVRIKKLAELIDQKKKWLNGDPFKTVSPEYADATKCRLDQILSNARFEDGFQTASQEFNRLMQELDDARSSPTNLLGQATGLVDKNDQTVEAKRAGELDASKWKGELIVIQKQLKAARGGAVDSDEIAGLTTMLDDCTKMVKDTQQFADGRQQLKAIAKRLSLLEANPNGLVISARNKLPKLTGFVKGEIIKTSKALAEISGAIEKIPDADLPAEDKKQVAAQLAAVRGLFNPAALDKSVPVVASQKTNRDKRASARETALKDVRRMMTYIDDDFRLQALGNAPYKPDMRAVISGLKLGLLDLENNLLVSMAQ